MALGINKLTGKPGPAPKPPRDGDKKQARQRINVEVRTGYRPRPGDLPCAHCGHQGDDRKHEYHHHLGYAAEHHYDVIPLCVKCHGETERVTHCKYGHEYTPENTVTKPNGTRQCRECRRAFDRKRHDAAYWRAYRKRRKARGNHKN